MKRDLQTKPKISLTTPSFNRMAWLKLCVDSVADHKGVEGKPIVKAAGTGPEWEQWQSERKSDDKRAPANTREVCAMSLIDLRMTARQWIGRYPALFYSTYGLLPKTRRLGLSQRTELVIEGFPRSANTFAVVAFLHLQPTEVGVSHHLHVPAQVIKAVRRGIPSLVLIRCPREAVASYLVFQPGISVRSALRSYCSYYATILPYRDGYVAADFETVVQRFHDVIAAVNERFGTTFAHRPLSDRDTEAVFRQLSDPRRQPSQGRETQSNRPSEDRKEAKGRALAQVERAEHRELLTRAEWIYRRFVAQAAAVVTQPASVT